LEISFRICRADGRELLFPSLPGSYQVIKSPQLVDFLQALARHIRRPMILVWDRLPAHRSQLVQDYIASLHGVIHQEYLPSYAPDLNPVEIHLGALEATRVAEPLSTVCFGCRICHAAAIKPGFSQRFRTPLG
jgi:transposase